MHENPYEPPSAALQPGNARKKRGIWWRIYFWFILISQSLYSIAIIAVPDTLQVKTLDYVDAVLYVGVLIAVYGFVYYKRILSRRSWQIFFPIILLWDTWSVIVDGDWEQWRQAGPIMIAAVVSVVVALMLPQYIALYRYGFGERELWSNEE